MRGDIYTGNKKLCGGAMGACKPKVSDVSVATVVSIIAALAATIAIVAALVILHRRRRQASQQREIVLTMPPEQAKLMSSGSNDLEKLEYGGSSHAGRPGHRRKASSLSGRKKDHSSTRLIFLRDDRPSFDLTDLLSASAEILGSGVFGSTYKAAMNDGSSSVMVVKKYSKMHDVARDEFHEHVRMLGKLKHPNVLPIVAYYYRKEEKLLVSDYCVNVSLAVHLHGK